ncbi:MAG: cytochrome c biogenesis protein CcsA, partial [Dehalococcoidia bacterium]
MAQAVSDKNRVSGVVSQLFLGITALAFAVNLYLIFFYVPIDQFSQTVGRMLYFHVPAAWSGMIALVVAAVCSVAYLRSRNRRWDRVAYGAVEVGTVFFTMAIVTGALWAKPIWNTWWVWDANGTLSFVLWIVFIGYLIVRAYAPTVDVARRWGAVVAVVGAAMAPFVYLAGDWWEGLHPVRVTGPGAEGELETSMRWV